MYHVQNAERPLILYGTRPGLCSRRTSNKHLWRCAGEIWTETTLPTIPKCKPQAKQKVDGIKSIKTSANLLRKKSANLPGICSNILPEVPPGDFTEVNSKVSLVVLCEIPPWILSWITPRISKEIPSGVSFRDSFGVSHGVHSKISPESSSMIPPGGGIFPGICLATHSDFFF